MSSRLDLGRLRENGHKHILNEMGKDVRPEVFHIKGATLIQFVGAYAGHKLSDFIQSNCVSNSVRNY